MVLKDGGKYLSTDVVVVILTIGISVTGTFFATRATLESRIEKLEAKLPVNDYLTSRAISHNLNQLSYLRTQIIDLTAEVNRISVPTLEFAKGVPKELSGASPAVWTPWQVNTEWVTNLADRATQVQPIDIDKLSKLLEGDTASALTSDYAFLRLQAFVQLANEFNRNLGELVYVFGAPSTQIYIAYPTLRRGASKESAELFVDQARDLLPRMKESLAGLQPIIDDEVHAARAILEKTK